ncbi:MAG: hypothetical protein F4X72_09470 [Dehalococcoidia bacterium]|nr:hypothetical protein [Dehalococcoidia bacterium]
MLHRMLPLELSLEFESRPYTLGETIEAVVEMQPSADIQVRSGRLDLVCEEHYTQRGVSFVPDFYASNIQISGQTSHVANDRKEQFVHSTIQFMQEARLNGGATTTRRVSLVVGTEPPPHFQESLALERDASSAWTFNWTLLATVDVARGRDAQVEREVKITLPK